MFRLTLLVLISFFAAETASACSPYVPLFTYSTYLEIKQHHYDEDYDQFKMILSSMQSANNQYVESDDNEDRKQRQISKMNEPENYAEYIKASGLFFDHEYKKALPIYIKLSTTIPNADSWVKEASTYMFARCQRNLAADTWDGYSNPHTNIDQVMLKNAKASYDRYLREYPHGLYVSSAQNIQRNILLLSGEQNTLNNALKSIMSVKGNVDNDALVNEFRRFYTGEVDMQHDAPIMLAFHIIYQGRLNNDDVQALDKRKTEFGSNLDVYRYLKLYTLLQLKNYPAMLTDVDENPINSTKISLSTAYLRFTAQAALNQESNALDTLLKMYAASPEAATLKHIGSLKLNNGHGLWLFSNEIAIQNPKALQAFAKYGLTDNELIAGLTKTDILQKEKMLLADELASRYLLNKNYTKLHDLLNQYTDLTFYNEIKADISTLSVNAMNIRANLNVGGFIYENYREVNLKSGEDLYNYEAELNELKDCQPCQAFTERTKNYAATINYFNFVLNSTNKSKEDHAGALHYLINCKHQGEHKERCTWGRSETNYDGKKYFTLLHHKYKNSTWASMTPYWYE